MSRKRSLVREPRCVPSASLRCQPRKTIFSNFREIVQDYIEHCRPHALRELHYFAAQNTLPEAIRVASLALIKTTKGKEKRHPHQRRIPDSSLARFHRALLSRRNVIRNCQTFNDLHDVCAVAASRIWKNAELTVYDTATRIGFFLGILPDRVYLHAGTRKGAKGLRLKENKSISMNQLPAEFKRLKPHEVEDCLCIYKEPIKRLQFC